MNLLQRYRSFLHQHLPAQGQRLLLAVSGGVDSAVLCHLTHKADVSFAIAHCNFSLRDSESEEDAAFVARLAKSYEVPLFETRFDTKQYAREEKLSIQEAARALRYRWFYQLLESETLAAVVTGHHADDNMETVLMNFFKGTGITGLRGMKPAQGKILRPLLDVTKEEILEYAAGNQLAWREDSSNLDSKYTRNFFRNEIFPLLEKTIPEVKSNLQQNLHRFRDAEKLYQLAVESQKKKLLEYRNGAVYIPVLKLQKATAMSTMVYEIIRAFGFSALQTEEVCRLLGSGTGRYVLSSTHRILKNRNWLIISPKTGEGDHPVVIDEEAASVFFGNQQMQVKRLPAAPAQLAQPSTVALLDVKELQFPLLLRKWNVGDYFYPLGMRRKKKLSRFFIDSKLSALEKEAVWVLESNKRIVWVVGHRIDDRFKVTPQTREVFRLTISSL